jgi:hypothetical protein
MDIQVKGNRQAQILAGVEPWETTTVSISLADLPIEQRELLAAGFVPTIISATAEAAIDALSAEVLARQAAAEKSAQEQAAKDAEITKWIETAELTTATSAVFSEEVRVEYTYFIAPSHSPYGASEEVKAAYAARYAALKDEAARLSEQTKAEALLAAEPQIRAAREAKEAREAAEKQARADVLKLKKARRAEINAVEISITRGESREWGTPWGATVTASRGKDHYDFDAAEYDLASEVLMIRCQPGDVIAWGQKNYRKPKNTLHERKRVSEDWGLVAI